MPNIKSLTHYKNPQVRDLAWACFSPTLFHSEKLSDNGQNLANCALGLTPARYAWLEQLDMQPGALLDHLALLHNGRLGLYFESLWHFFLHQDKDVDLLAHNLPIRDEGRTLGEFDCLYYCRQRQRHVHLELAVKYYLSHRTITTDQSTSRWSEWLGATGTDNLDRKIKHLTQHQIGLGDRPLAKRQLEQLGITSLLKEVEIKGYLFQSQDVPLPTPYAYNQQNTVSHWLSVDSLEAHLSTSPGARYKILPKREWLAPSRLEPLEDKVLGVGELTQVLREHFQNLGRPQLVAQFDASDIETQRLFITGPSWPASD